MLDATKIIKLNKLIANIKNNYPRLKISVNLDVVNGFLTLYIKYGKNKLFATFGNIGSCLLCLNFLYNANFSANALKAVSKKKIHKRKRNLFFLWLEKGQIWEEINNTTLGELWAEFEQEIAPPEEAQETPPREELGEEQGES